MLTLPPPVFLSIDGTVVVQNSFIVNLSRYNFSMV